MKSSYIVEEETDIDSHSHDEGVVYDFIKNNYDEDEKTILTSYVIKGDRWISDSSFSHHIIGDKSKFETL